MTAQAVEPGFAAKPAADQKWKPTVIFLLGGQSNMVGHGKVAELEEALRSGPANVRIWDKTGWVALTPAGTFGPEVSFAAAMAKAWPNERIGLIKHARGGTSLLAWAPDWKKEDAARTGNDKAGALYAPWMAALRAARAMAPEARVAAAFWMQGERDALYPEAADNYRTNFMTLIAAVRRDSGNANLPFIFGRIRSGKLAKSVRGAQEETAREVAGVIMVNTDDLEPVKDLHWGAKGQVELGRRFAAAFLGLNSSKDRGETGKMKP
jgi:hypothetical protein